MLNMTLFIDNVDFSSYLPPRGYTVNYNKIVGDNSMTTLDGVYHEDVLAYKAVISTELRPMTSEKLTAIMIACANASTATYYDPKLGETVTKFVIATLSPASIVMNDMAGTIWNNNTSSGVMLTIEER